MEEKIKSYHIDDIVDEKMFERLRRGVKSINDKLPVRSHSHPLRQQLKLQSFKQRNQVVPVALTESFHVIPLTISRQPETSHREEVVPGKLLKVGSHYFEA